MEMKNLLKKWMVRIGIIFFLFLLTISIVSGAQTDSATGTVSINAIPVLSGVNFTNATDFTVISTIYPFGYAAVNFTLDHSATIADIGNVTIRIYDDSQHGALWDTASPDGLQLVEFRWNESDDQWTVTDQGSFTLWSVNNTESIDPGASSSSTSFEFSMIFRPSKAARYDTDWNVSCRVFDDSPTPDTDEDSETGLVTMAAYFEVSHSTSEYTWGEVEENTVNASITPDTLTVDVISNIQWELSILGSDFTANGESDIDLDVTDCLAWDFDGVAGGTDNFWIRNTATIGTDNWDNQSPLSTESAVSRNVKILFSDGGNFAAGKQWNVTTTVECQANT
jgi:hypothetical protein